MVQPKKRARARRADDETIVDRLYDELLRRILSDELPAGSRLPPERELAAAHDTNRNTVREAVRRLEQAKLVSARQGQGVTVADFRRSATLDQLGAFLEHGADAREKTRVLLDLLAPRLYVAELLVSLAATNATADDLRALDAAVRVARAYEKKKDQRALVAAQQRWLELLVEATHSMPVRWVANPLLEAIRDLLDRYPMMMPLDPSFTDHADDVVDAITARDAGAAAARTRKFHEEVDRRFRRLVATLVT